MKREQDAKNAFDDYAYDQAEEDRHREQGDKFKKVYQLWKEAKERIDKGEGDQEDVVTLRKGSHDKFQAWIKKSRDARIAAVDRKEKNWARKEKIDTELQRLLSLKGGNAMGIDDNGDPYKIVKAAPSYIKQSLKRPQELVAKDFATNLCYSENLKKLDFTTISKLVKEYQECFTNKDEMFDILGFMWKHIEENKKSLNREQLAYACHPALTKDNQTMSIKAMKTITKNYEFSLPAIKYLENEQREADQKTVSDIRKKRAIRDADQDAKYKRVVEGKGKKPYNNNNTNNGGNKSNKRRQPNRPQNRVQKSSNTEDREPPRKQFKPSRYQKKTQKKASQGTRKDTKKEIKKEKE